MSIDFDEMVAQHHLLLDGKARRLERRKTTQARWDARKAARILVSLW